MEHDAIVIGGGHNGLVAAGYLARAGLRPLVLEARGEYGLIGGNIFHGELSPDQLFHMRPAPGYADYTTPIGGLYQCGSATHAGGGVTGIPGYLCSKRIISDKKRQDLKAKWRLGR